MAPPKGGSAVSSPAPQWASLLLGGLHASADDLVPLDAKALVRLVDRRVRGLRSEGLQKLDTWLQQGNAGRGSHGGPMASFAELTQKWPALHGPPGLGAFKLAPGAVAPPREFEQLRSSLKQAAASMRRSASASSLGRTLARTMSGRDLASSRAGGEVPEWDLFKSLDANLKTLERALRDSTSKQRKQAVKRRPKRRDGEDAVRGAARVRALPGPGVCQPPEQAASTRAGPRRCVPNPLAAPLALHLTHSAHLTQAGGPPSLLLVPPFAKGAPFGDALPDLQAALKDFQRTVEKHLPKAPAVGA